jgi:taurine transport system permease protein
MTARRDRSVPLRWIVSGSSVAMLFAAWYLITGPLGLVSSLKFPSPLDAYESFIRLIRPPGYADGILAQHILASTELVLIGFLLATATGVPLGLLMGRNRLVDGYVNPVFQLIRPIAPIAWIPLTILWFGLGIGAKLFVIWLAAFAPAVINTYTGVRNIDTTVIQAARVHGASSKEMLFDVVIPGALPSIFTGLRTSLQACWMVLVAAELVGSFVGLGHIMIIASRDLNSGMILVAMICVALLGVLMSVGLTYVERYAIPWRR